MACIDDRSPLPLYLANKQASNNKKQQALHVSISQYLHPNILGSGLLYSRHLLH